MRKKYMLIRLVGIVVGVLLSSVAVVLAGQIDSPGAPDSNGAQQMYTLEQIYDRLDTGAETAKMTSFTEPDSGPGSTMHALDEIMAMAPAADNASGAGAADVFNSKTFWGLTSGEWGTGSGALNLACNTSTFNGAANLVANAYDGSGDGTNRRCMTDSGDATAGDILQGKIAWVDGSEVTGELHGGCTCCSTCTLHANRWCDNGDGTVTDLTTCLVWLQKADWGGAKPWEDCTAPRDDAHTRAGLLKDGASGANLSDGSVEGDWRLPTKTELVGLVNGTPQLRCAWPGPCTLYAFTGVQSYHYWSSTTYADNTVGAWDVDLRDGYVGFDAKTATYYVWPVRGGQ